MVKPWILIFLLFETFAVYPQRGNSVPDSVVQNAKSTREFGGPYALVAGGSKGIGFAIAEALAKRGFNLILIARREEALNNAKQKLESGYGIQVEILMFDLSKEGSAREIGAWCFDRNIRLKVLCNVAGLGGDDDYLSQPLDTMRYMVDLNLESGMAMTQTLLPLLEKNAPSFILNVASMAAFAPIPSKNMYSATKVGVLYFSYALRFQLKDRNISVSCLAPGPVFTKPRIKEETKRTLGWLGMQMAVEPARVGEVAVRRTLKGRLLIVPGTIAKISSTLIRILPRRTVTSIYSKIDKG